MDEKKTIFTPVTLFLNDSPSYTILGRRGVCSHGISKVPWALKGEGDYYEQAGAWENSKEEVRFDQSSEGWEKFALKARSFQAEGA